MAYLNVFHEARVPQAAIATSLKEPMFSQRPDADVSGLVVRPAMARVLEHATKIIENNATWQLKKDGATRRRQLDKTQEMQASVQVQERCD
jgi:hypothetical protein